MRKQGPFLALLGALNAIWRFWLALQNLRVQGYLVTLSLKYAKPGFKIALNIFSRNY